MRWVPCLNSGDEETGDSEGLLEALHADKGKGIGRIKCGKGRGVPVTDSIAATGSLVMAGCGWWVGGGKIVWGLGMMWGAVEER